ncbi:hypothetical protein [Streptomyces sp. NPDC002746]
MTWLSDTTLRIGGLTGLHLVDLHLRENAACGEDRSPHVHVCHRQGDPNGARAKKKELNAEAELTRTQNEVLVQWQRIG